MKKLFISRRAILRAVRAACLASVFLASTNWAAAQMYSAPFQVNGSTVTTGSGNYGNGAGLYEPVANYSSVTIGAQTAINATVSYAASDGLNQALVQTSTSSFSNAGTISLATTNSGAYQAATYLDQGALSITASNSGTISATSGGSSNEALDIASTSGNLSYTNTSTGSLYSNGSNSNGGLLINSTAGGNISINNNQGGTITIGPTSAVYVVEAHAYAGGDVSVNNAGTVSGYSGAYARGGIVAQANTGNVQFINSGTITHSQYGVTAASDSGNVTATNSGYINASETGLSVGGSSATVINSGTITGSGYHGLAIVANNVVVQNSGSISGTGSGSYIYQYGGPGIVQVQNSGTIDVGGDGIDVHADPSTPSMVSNSGTINSGGTGIMLFNPGVVTNSGSITGTTAAINVPSGSSVILQGNASTNGTIIGGANSGSLSTLSFALNIPASQYAAAQSQLAAEIAAYTAQMGGDYTFDIDGRIFDVSNFLYAGGITDDLVAQIIAMQRMYSNVPGFQSLGTVLDNLNPNTAPGTAILNALGNVSDANLPSALAELSPKELEVFRNVAFDNNTFNATQINNHLANLRDGLTGFDSSALTIQDSSMDPTLNEVNSHLLAYNPASTPGLLSDSNEPIFGAIDMKEVESNAVNTMPTQRWSSFIAGNVILADLSNNANLEDSDYTTGSITAGVDYRFDDHFTVGALFAYSHTDANLDSRGSSATVDSYSPGLYASYVDGGWYANGMATYNRNAYTDDREIDIAGISGDNHGGTSGNQGDLNLTGGYEFQKGAFKFGPVASAEYVHLQIDSLQEQGPSALTINNQNQDSFRSLLGFEGRFDARIHTPVGTMILTPHISASWQHEYLDNSDGITSQFNGTGGGSFVTQTDSPDRDSAFVDAGLDAKVSQNVTIFVDYSAQAGQQNFFAQSAQGGVKIGF